MFPPIDPINIVLGLAFFLVVFMLMREIFCWYWKINRIVDLLEKLVEQKTGQKEDAPKTPIQ
ncbi:MAG: hypothetical protein AAB691_00770 [Patescibacteria group bacterium]